MKKYGNTAAALLLAALCPFLGGCGGGKAAGVDIDLARMSGTAVYAEVFNMVTEPEEYVGKTIRMDGRLSMYQDSRNGRLYFTCVVQDATACCSQGLEFERKGEFSYPEDYPPMDAEIEVTGVFTRYEEEGVVYYHVADAVLEQVA